MALSAKLTLRQGQTMVLTPQLLQAIKLLQMPNFELSSFIETELASNPLLELAEDRELRSPEAPQAPEAEPEGPSSDGGVEAGDWASESLEVDAGRSGRQPRHGSRERLRVRIARRGCAGQRLVGEYLGGGRGRS